MPHFGKYEHPDTIEAAYLKGYKTGIKWTHPWEPGGPFALKDDITRDPDWRAYCKHTEAVRKHWLVGWKTGFTSQEDG